MRKTAFLLAILFSFFVLDNSKACDGLVPVVASNTYIGNGEYLLEVEFCETVSNGSTLNGVLTDNANIFGIIITVNGANILGINTPSITGISSGLTVFPTQTAPNQVEYGDWGNPNAPVLLEYGDPGECWTIFLVVDGPATTVDVWGSSYVGAVQPGFGMVDNNGTWGCGTGIAVPPVICQSEWTPPSFCIGSTTPIDLNATTMFNGVFSGPGVNSATGMFDPSGFSGPVTVTLTVGDAFLNCSTTHDITPVNLIPPVLTDTTICEGDAVDLDATITVAGGCDYLLELEDSFGDGWNGADIDIYINGVLFLSNQAVPNCGAGPCITYITIPVMDGDVITLNYSGGTWDSENTVTLYDANGTQVASVNDPPDGWLGAGTTANCPNGILTYSWSPAAGLSVPNDPITTATPLVTTTYTVDITAPALGCTVQAPVTITVINCNGCTPPALILDDQTVCDPTTVDLNNTINPASGVGIATFYNSQTDADNATGAIGAVVAVSGTYWVRLEDPNDPTCYTVASVNVTVNPTYSTTENFTVCEGDSYTYPDGTIANNILIAQSHTSNFATVAGCDSIIITNLSVNPIPTSIENYTMCTGSNHTYPDGTVSNNILIDESHVSTLTAVTGCDSLVTTNIIITQAVTASENITICPGEDVTYPDGTVSMNIQVNESHVSQFVSVFGCDSLLTTNVIVSPLPNIDAGSNITVCENESVILTASGGVNYQWDQNVQNGQSFIPPLGSTVYHVTGWSAEGCQNDDSVTVTVSTGPVVSFIGDDLYGCAPHTVTFTNLTQGSASCTWDFGNGESSNDCGPVTITYDNPGLYSVSLNVVDVNGCTGSATYNQYITVESDPLAGFVPSTYTIGPFNTQVSFNNTTVNGTQYTWDFGDHTYSSDVDPIHNYADGTSNYLVTLHAVNDAGCTDSISLVITYEEEIIFYIPNTFTPDGDDYNEFFQAIFTSGYDPYDFDLFIYNRWGEIIWESHDVSVGWDGTYGGKIVQDGTYTWKIEFKETMTDERHMHTGHVNVIR